MSGDKHLYIPCFQGVILHHNVTVGIIISNQSLVLQDLERKDAGAYACKATNAEGTSASDKLSLNIKCKKIAKYIVLIRS